MRCEDYPCCGHTDGLPCDWTYTPEAQEFDRIHAFCDHEAGFCDADYDEPDDYPTREKHDEAFWIPEDEWLDGSYEE